jgi:hypothetical protein
MFARRYDWANNMPLYPAYVADNFARFVRAHGSTAAALTEEQWMFKRDEAPTYLGTICHSVEKGIAGITVQLKESGGTIDNYEYVVLFTDGVTQVDGMDWKDAVLSLVSFKNVAGSFAKRRMISFIKDARKQGKGPMDDIAFAVIRIGADEEMGNAS